MFQYLVLFYVVACNKINIRGCYKLFILIIYADIFIFFNLGLLGHYKN